MRCPRLGPAGARERARASRLLALGATASAARWRLAHRGRARACRPHRRAGHLPGRRRRAVRSRPRWPPAARCSSDVAIGLALVGFVGTVGWARLIERGAAAAERSPERAMTLLGGAAASPAARCCW
ncbi:MAG: hypothetical protein MZW92_81055 [Comamonadaceae bacterium]|nr:hypothetical protein [Comamonadaceae bacterium]